MRQSATVPAASSTKHCACAGCAASARAPPYAKPSAPSCHITALVLSSGVAVGVSVGGEAPSAAARLAAAVTPSRLSAVPSDVPSGVRRYWSSPPSVATSSTCGVEPAARQTASARGVPEVATAPRRRQTSTGGACRRHSHASSGSRRGASWLGESSTITPRAGQQPASLLSEPSASRPWTDSSCEHMSSAG
eukprot:7378574-Prymnesium_polylepis.1